jgi:GR25 family glycosyltransferase involved in LPS biosynthesis
MYTGYYINLSRAQVKKEALENMLTANGLHNYQRFEAIDGETNVYASMKLTGGEKGCFLSHYQVLKDNRESSEIIHIIEDDAIVNDKITIAADAIASLDDTKGDIIFTEVLVQPTAGIYLQFRDLLKEYNKTNKIQALNLKGRDLTSATSYFVNPKSISKIITLIESNVEASPPYDLLLRQLVDSGQLKASVLIPFFTYHKFYPGEDSIRNTSVVEMMLMKLRESFWIDADLPKVLAETDRNFDSRN